MPNATFVLTCKTELSETNVNGEILKPDSREAIQALLNYVTALSSGAARANITAQTSASAPVVASHTITVDQSAVTADDEIIVLGVTLTAKASGANGTTEFDAVTDDATMATNLAACINANTTLSNYVSAEAAAAVVTITTLAAGSIANYLTASALGTITSGTPFTISGAYTGGAGGAESAVKTYSFGIA